MGFLQNEVKSYLERYGISKSHMATIIGISIQQLSAWSTGKLVLPEYHIRRITQYVNTLKEVDEFLQSNNLVM